jgi:hypothetical protein
VDIARYLLGSKCVVQDLAEVVQDAEVPEDLKPGGTLQFMAHDFFGEQTCFKSQHILLPLNPTWLVRQVCSQDSAQSGNSLKVRRPCFGIRYVPSTTVYYCPIMKGMQGLFAIVRGSLLTSDL